MISAISNFLLDSIFLFRNRDSLRQLCEIPSKGLSSKQARLVKYSGEKLVLLERFFEHLPNGKIIICWKVLNSSRKSVILDEDWLAEFSAAL